MGVRSWTLDLLPRHHQLVDVMKDLAIALDNRPGALAEMGEALGKAGVSVEGGDAWSPSLLDEDRDTDE